MARTAVLVARLPHGTGKQRPSIFVRATGVHERVHADLLGRSKLETDDHGQVRPRGVAGDLQRERRTFLGTVDLAEQQRRARFQDRSNPVNRLTGLGVGRQDGCHQKQRKQPSHHEHLPTTVLPGYSHFRPPANLPGRMDCDSRKLQLRKVYGASNLSTRLGVVTSMRTLLCFLKVQATL